MPRIIGCLIPFPFSSLPFVVFDDQFLQGPIRLTTILNVTLPEIKKIACS